MQIRVATTEDEPAIQRVIKSVYDEYSFTWDPSSYHADLYDLKAAYFDIGDTFYVAELAGVVVGTIALERFETIEGVRGTLHGRRIAGCDCSMERLYVHPQGRNHGVGSTLARWIIDVAKREGRIGMEIWSDKKFADAHRLYQRLGATVVGERICDDPDESPEWGLWLPLI